MKARQVSQQTLWRMKRKAQARDRALLARGEVAPEAMLLLRPNRLQGARITWPRASVREEELSSALDWEIAARKRAHRTEESAAVVIDAVMRTTPPLHRKSSKTTRRRAQIVYIIYGFYGPLAAFAKIGEAQEFLERRCNPRNYAMARLYVRGLSKPRSR